MSRRKKPSPSNSASEQSTLRPGRAVLAAYYFTLLIGLATSLFPDSRTWGFSVWSYLPTAAAILVFALAAVAPFLIPSLLDPNAERRLRITVGSLAAALAVGFVSLPSTTFFLGDGRTLLSQLADSSPMFFKSRSVAAAWINSAAYDLLGVSGVDGAQAAFRLTSTLLGFLYLIVLWLISTRLFDRSRQRAVFVAAVATGGYILNYFGYVEFYGLFNVVVLLLLGAGLLALRGRLSRWWLIPLLFVAFGGHIFAIAFVPAVLFALIRPSVPGSRIASLPLQVVLAFMLLLFVVAAAVLALVLQASQFVQFAVLYILPNRFAIDGYTMFSVAHLLDMLNLLALLAPGLPVLLAAAWLTRHRLRPLPVEIQFLLLALLGALLTVFVFDPKLGMPRDWDLFSFVGQPLLFTGAVLLLHERVVRPATMAAVVLAAVLGIIWLLPRAVVQHTEEVAIKRLNDYIALDQTKNRVAMHILHDYYIEQGQPSRAQLVAQRIQQQYPEEELYLEAERLLRDGQLSQAMALFDRVIELNPHIGAAWSNKGMILLQSGRINEAVEQLEIAYGLNQNNSQIMHALALGYVQRFELDRAEQMWERAVDADPSFVQPYLALTNLYIGRNEVDKAVSLLKDGRQYLPPQTIDSVVRQYPTVRARW